MIRISFITYVYPERMMGSIKELNERGVKIDGKRTNNLFFADDIHLSLDLIEDKMKRLQESLSQMKEAGEKVDLEININKRKTMVNERKDTEEEQLSVKDKKTENITEFVYLGSLLTEDNDESRGIQRRIARASGAMEQDGKIWRSKNISTKPKSTY